MIREIVAEASYTCGVEHCFGELVNFEDNSANCDECSMPYDREVEHSYEFWAAALERRECVAEDCYNWVGDSPHFEGGQGPFCTAACLHGSVQS